MSIEDKFEQMSAEYEKKPDDFLESKKINTKERNEERLRQLEIIRGSLDLRSNESEDTGKGMKEYSNDVKENFDEHNTKIKNIVSGNRNLMGAYGIEEPEQFVASKELSKDEEVGEYVRDLVGKYKKADEDKKQLYNSDAELRKKLISLGVYKDSVENARSYDNLIYSIDKQIEYLREKIEKETEVEKEQDNPSLEIYQENKKDEETQEQKRIREQKEMIDNFILRIEEIEKKLPDEEITYYGNSEKDKYYFQILQFSSEKNMNSEIERLGNKRVFFVQEHNKKIKALDKIVFKTVQERDAQLDALEKEKKEQLEEIKNGLDKLRGEVDKLKEKSKILVNMINENPGFEEIIRKCSLAKKIGKPLEIFEEFKNELIKAKEKLEKQQ